MANPYGIPEITAKELAEKRSGGGTFRLVDVREDHELHMANLGDEVIHVPLSEIVENRLEALPPELADQDQEIVVFCHHGARSAQVAAFLSGNGYSKVINLEGGIHAYAMNVDPTVGTY
ncbi:MAG: rhodanese-like domain-containing protein [Chloroflexota bacterium]